MTQSRQPSEKELREAARVLSLRALDPDKYGAASGLVEDQRITNFLLKKKVSADDLTNWLKAVYAQYPDIQEAFIRQESADFVARSAGVSGQGIFSAQGEVKTPQSCSFSLDGFDSKQRENIESSFKELEKIRSKIVSDFKKRNKKDLSNPKHDYSEKEKRQMMLINAVLELQTGGITQDKINRIVQKKTGLLDNYREKAPYGSSTVKGVKTIMENAQAILNKPQSQTASASDNPGRRPPQSGIR